MNNILIVGTAKENTCINSLLLHAEPEEAKVFTHIANLTKELKGACEKLQVPFEVLSEENASYFFKTAIFFTDYIGISEVDMLTDLNKEGTEVVFINQQLKA